MAKDNTDIRAFLDSGLLEEYLIGNTDEQTTRMVEQYIDDHAEVREAWDAMQETLEMMALSESTEAPPDLSSSIKSAIRNLPSANESQRSAAIRRMNRMVVAASIAAFLFAAVAIAEVASINRYKQQVASLNERIDALESELEDQNMQFAALESEFSIVRDPNTQKVIINGNDNARGFVMVAYWNEEKQASFMQVINQPELPQKQCFQLWADVHGEMVNMGVIPNEKGLIALDFKLDAESLNVTIEPEGGSEHPNVSRLVGSVAI